MNLYERDFTKLTPEEDGAWRVVKEKEQEHVSGEWAELGAKMNLFRDYPKAARHFDSLFPNNYLDIVELEDECNLQKKVEAFVNLLGSDEVNERIILNHIK